MYTEHPPMYQTGWLGCLRDVWRKGREDPAALQAVQQARLAQLVDFARRHSPLYRARYKALPDDVRDLRQIPPMTKPDLMTHFDNWVTDRGLDRDGVETFLSDPKNIGDLCLDQYTVWTSSGTTGTPGIFLQDQGALRIYASLALMRGLKGWLTAGDLLKLLQRGPLAVALIATGGHWASDSVKEHLRKHSSYAARRIVTLSILETVPEMVQRLNALNPPLILGYPTAFQLLAEQQVAGRMAVEPLLVVSAAERLTPRMAGEISGAFGRRVREVYAAAECMGIAYSCDDGWLHVNSDWVILEPVDADYESVPAGEPSYTVLLTNLANRIQPIIRYDLGDSVRVKPSPCPCRNPFPAIQVEGRKDDVLHLRSTEGEWVPVLPMALETVIERVPGVHQYQILQTAPDRLVLRLVGPRELGEKVQGSVRAYLGSMGLDAVQVTLLLEAPARDPISGKYQRISLDRTYREDPSREALASQR